MTPDEETVLQIEGFDGENGDWKPLFYYREPSKQRTTAKAHLGMIIDADDDHLIEQGISEYDDFRLVEIPTPGLRKKRTRTPKAAAKATTPTASPKRRKKAAKRA